MKSLQINVLFVGIFYVTRDFYIYVNFPSKHFLFSKTSWGRLKDIFNVTIFLLPRRLQDVFKTFSRSVCKNSSKYVFKASSKHLQGVFTRRVFKTFSRHLFEDIFKTSSRRLANTFWICFEDALKNPWKTKICWVEFFDLKDNNLLIVSC